MTTLATWNLLPPIVIVATQALAFLGKQKSPTACKLVATATSCSISYMEHIFFAMRDSGLVTAQRGPGGGYELARAAESISLSDIFEVFVEQPGPPMPPAFASLREQIRHVLRGTSLQKYMEQG